MIRLIYILWIRRISGMLYNIVRVSGDLAVVPEALRSVDYANCPLGFSRVSSNFTGVANEMSSLCGLLLIFLVVTLGVNFYLQPRSGLHTTDHFYQQENKTTAL